MKTQGDKKALYTIDEAGEYLGMSSNTIRGLVTDGTLVSVRIASRLFVHRQDMDKLIEKNKTPYRPHQAFAQSARRGHAVRAERKAQA